MSAFKFDYNNELTSSQWWITLLTTIIVFFIWAFICVCTQPPIVTLTKHQSFEERLIPISKILSFFIIIFMGLGDLLNNYQYNWADHIHCIVPILYGPIKYIAFILPIQTLRSSFPQLKDKCFVNFVFILIFLNQISQFAIGGILLYLASSTNNHYNQYKHEDDDTIRNDINWHRVHVINVCELVIDLINVIGVIIIHLQFCYHLINHLQEMEKRYANTTSKLQRKLRYNGNISWQNDIEKVRNFAKSITKSILEIFLSGLLWRLGTIPMTDSFGLWTKNVDTLHIGTTIGLLIHICIIEYRLCINNNHKVRIATNYKIRKQKVCMYSLDNINTYCKIHLILTDSCLNIKCNLRDDSKLLVWSLIDLIFFCELVCELICTYVGNSQSNH